MTVRTLHVTYMLRTFLVFPCMFGAALGLAPVIPPRPAFLPAALASSMEGASLTASFSSSADLAPSLRGQLKLRGQSHMPLPATLTRAGLDPVQLTQGLSKSQGFSQGLPKAKVWSTVVQQPKETRFITGRFVQAATVSVSSWMVGALLLVALSAVSLWWRLGVQAVRNQDSQIEMAVSKSILRHEEPNFAVAAFCGESVEERHEIQNGCILAPSAASFNDCGRVPGLLHSTCLAATSAVGATAAPVAFIPWRCQRRRAGSRVVARAKIWLEPGEKAVGIDLGTTNSAVAALEAGQPIIVPNAEGQRTTPSVVAFAKSGETLVGSMAKRQAAVNPENTFYSVKRFIGRQPKDALGEAKEVAYGVETLSAGTRIVLKCPQKLKKLSPEDISAQVLRKLAADAASFLQADVKKAVITVPAYFSDSQRQATKDAGTIAGLEVLRIVNEPTAASLAYGLDMKSSKSILVFDLGGGTFDVSVLSVGGGVCEVLSTSGDTRLGGDNFDKEIVDWLADDFNSRFGIDLREDRQALQRLNEAAEKAKIELSDVQDSLISLPFISVQEEPRSIEQRLSREKFEGLCADLMDRLRGPVLQALEDAELDVADIEELVLVGGSTRIPSVQRLAKELLGGRKPNQSVNPDEVVAIGAAVQAGVLTGEVKSLVLIDIVPLSLSVATHDGQVSTFIRRNTRVPVKKTKEYTTYKDNQKSVAVRVVQGERQLAKNNETISTFDLKGIPRAPMGKPKIEVTFDVDSNGILTVEALDKATQRQQKVTITGASTLAPEDVEQKVKEAAEAAEEEAAVKEGLFVKNEAESACFALERLFRERKDAPQKRREIIESKILSLRAELANDTLDLELIKEVTEDLMEEYKEVSKPMVQREIDVKDGLVNPDGTEIEWEGSPMNPKAKAKRKKKVV